MFIGEIGLLFVVLLVLYFVVEIGVPAVDKTKKLFWLTKYVFGKPQENISREPLDLDKQIANAEQAVEYAKLALESLSGSAAKGSSEAKREYQRLEKVYKNANTKLNALNKTKTRKRVNN
jgi:hypothetical protein